MPCYVIVESLGRIRETVDAILCDPGGASPIVKPIRAAFRKAAETALATQPECWGEGSAYHVIARL